MKTKLQISSLTLTIFSLVLAGVVGWLLHYWWSSKTAFVQVAAVYDKFDYTKELSKKFETIKRSRQNILDSLKIEVQKVGRTYQQNPNDVNRKVLEYKREEFLTKESDFATANQAVAKQYEELIWKQLNQYIQDFGKKTQYRYIYGATGTGSLMYANDSENITDKVVDFINKRYKGGSL